MSKKVAQVIVGVLESAGVEHRYGIVADTLNTFASSSRQRSRRPRARASAPITALCFGRTCTDFATRSSRPPSALALCSEEG
jgi:hypothetical protein